MLNCQSRAIDHVKEKGERKVEKESVEDNFDEMLKVFEGDTDLQGQVCESSIRVSFFI